MNSEQAIIKFGNTKQMYTPQANRHMEELSATHSSPGKRVSPLDSYSLISTTRNKIIKQSALTIDNSRSLYSCNENEFDLDICSTPKQTLNKSKLRAPAFPFGGLALATPRKKLSKKQNIPCSAPGKMLTQINTNVSRGNANGISPVVIKQGKGNIFHIFCAPFFQSRDKFNARIKQQCQTKPASVDYAKRAAYKHESGRLIKPATTDFDDSHKKQIRNTSQGNFNFTMDIRLWIMPF